MDLSTSVTTNISSWNTTHLSANKPRILSHERPYTVQVSWCGNELNGMHRRCMPNTKNRQGKHLLASTPTTKQVTCWSLRIGTDMRNTTTYGTKDDQRVPPKEKRTTWADPLDEVLQRWMLATQRRKNEESLLPQETNTWGKESERMGKGREDRPLGGGERKNPAGYRSLPKANPRAIGGTGQKQENDCQPRNECRKSEKNDHKLGIHARKSVKRGEDPPSSNGEIRGPQKLCPASWAEVVRFWKLALGDQRCGRGELMSQIMTKQGRFHMTNSY